LEGGELAAAREARRVFVAGGRARGFRTVPVPDVPPEFLERDGVPGPVRETACGQREFLAAQAPAVLAMGRADAGEGRRLVVNAHLDTVGPHVPPRLTGDPERPPTHCVLHGRGAVDAKGPAVAALAGVSAAFAAHPWLAGVVEAQVHGVFGEEGGAMGTYGTRWLVERGFAGRLTLFAEPTGGRVLDACTATMTPRVTVRGEGSTDDHPAGGHNATIALGFLAELLARRLGPRVAALGGTLCVAGLRTGTAHNRVYGDGELLLNLGYRDAAGAAALERALIEQLDAARYEFAAAHAGNPLTARLVADWDRVVRLDWLKRGLPALANRDPAMEALLAATGFPRHDGLADGTAFTCDAVWAAAPGRYVAVCGPGRLDVNGAHTPDEYVAVADLAAYAERIAELVVRFGRHVIEGDEYASAEEATQ
jgi:acetylornithine deacetylase